MHHPQISTTKCVGMIGVILLLTINFYSNYFQFSDDDFYQNFQRDSESLVVGRILVDKTRPDNQERFNLGYGYTSEGIFESYKLLKNNDPLEHYKPYVSHYGLQGDLFSTVYNTFGIDSINSLKLINSLLSVLSLLLLGVLIKQIYGGKIAILSIAVLALSPWFIAISNNLYWATFNWLTPVIFGFLAYLKLNEPGYKVYLALFGFSVFFKCLFGMEYLSSLLILAAIPFVLDPFMPKPKQSIAHAAKQLSALVTISVIGFAMSLVVLADLRGDSLIEGFKAIWEQDVLRRTYGDPADFPPAYAESLTISSGAVVKSYFVDWTTDLLPGIPGEWFLYLSVFSVVSIGYLFVIKHPYRMLLLCALVVALAVPISWFVLAKGHSHIHKHINFVLWYLGPIQVMLAVSFIAGVKGFGAYVSRCLDNKLYIAITPVVVLAIYAATLSGDNRDFEQYLASLTENGIPLTSQESDIQLYAVGENTLWLQSKDCPESKTGAAIVMDIKFRTQSAPLNAKVDWRDSQLAKANWLSEHDGHCIARVDYPTYRMDSGTIQITEQGEPIATSKIETSMIRKTQELLIVPVQINRFVNGVSTQTAAFVTENSFINRQSIEEGVTINLAHSGQREIKKIVYSNNLLVVVLNGGKLDPDLDTKNNVVQIIH